MSERLQKKAGATHEQLSTYSEVREVLKPYEDMLNARARELESMSSLPSGVRRKGHSYRVQMILPTGEKTEVRIETKKTHGKTHCSSFRIGRSQLWFSDQGEISQFMFRSGQHPVDPIITEWVKSSSPKSMGFYVPGLQRFPVKGDGTCGFRPDVPFATVVQNAIQMAIPIEMPPHSD